MSTYDAKLKNVIKHVISGDTDSTKQQFKSYLQDKMKEQVKSFSTEEKNSTSNDAE